MKAATLHQLLDFLKVDQPDQLYHEAQVSQFLLNADGVLVVELSVGELFGGEQLIRLERLLEKNLSVPQVIVRQRGKQEFSATEKHRFLQTASAWICRHAEISSNFEGRIVARGQGRLEDGNFCWVVPPMTSAVLSQNHENWLHTFWRFNGPFGTQLRILENLAEEVADCSEQTARVLNDVALEGRDLLRQIGSDPANRAPRGSKTNDYGRSLTDSGNGTRHRKKHRVSDRVLWGKPGEPIPLIAVGEIDHEIDRALFKGEVFHYETLVTRNQNLLVKFSLTDLSGSIACVLFGKQEQANFFRETIKGQYLQITADISYDDRYTQDFQAKVTCIERAERPLPRQDTAEEKRVELHIHSKMSAKDATAEAKDIVRRAAEMGHPAVAITDHGVVQGFPDAANMAVQMAKKGKPIKVIYGVEGYLLDDGADAVAYQIDGVTLTQGFIALDVETTGLEPARDRLIEVAAVHYVKNADGQYEETAVFQSLIDPQTELSDKVQQLSGITPQMLAGQPTALEILPRLLDFIGDLPVVAHNALFDLNFIRYEGFRLPQSEPRCKFNPPLIDTLALARILFPQWERHRLQDLATQLSLKPERQHRALADARVCGQAFSKLLDAAGTEDLARLNQLAGLKTFQQLKAERKKTNHIVLLARDALGLYNLYRLISESHLNYFYYRPRIPRSVLTYFGAGIIRGSACVYGEIFSLVLDTFKAAEGDFQKARQNLLASRENVRLAARYDYLEIQPLSNNRYLQREAGSFVRSDEDLRNLNRLVVALAEASRRPVCATCDAHYLEPEDGIYRRILLSDQNFEDAEQSADLYLRTTDEMLAEFAYLGEELAEQVVVTNPARFAAQVDGSLKPFPDGSFPPAIAGAEEQVRELTFREAERIYGRDGQLPEQVRARIDKELRSIIDNGFSVMYYIAHAVVAKSNSDGYIVGSRGSVGSSLVATLCGITEVNPLRPHYICPECHYCEFDESGEYGSGYDLPAKDCPECGTRMNQDGQDIPFETFLGFDGDKQPDIDLNFSGFYQPRAHQFIEEMFGSSHTFRAGTISGYAEKNSAAMVEKYYEASDVPVGRTEISRLAKGIQGVKRTTGQHPGGLVVVPKEYDVYDFTPIQNPADRSETGIVTTHFDFNSMHETILKLDILGHDDPSMLKMLGDISGVNVTTIPIPDPQVMSLFHSTAALGIPDEESMIGSATIGLPELGTMMARNMIAETKPSSFFDLVQLSGLSHGENVWTDNAQSLIRDGICTIKEVIGCRDSIMTYLIYNGLPPKDAFEIMEKVRKGRGVSEEHETMMREHQVPDWYLESCKKISYMFPKAHAAAYIISALRIAWFKVNYPEAYYCAYFTVRATDFSSEELCLPAEEIRVRRAGKRREFHEMTPQDQKKFFYLELVEEMQQRGIDFLPISLSDSKATEFYSPEKGKIRPPFNAIPTISDNLAQQIVAARVSGDAFRNREELSHRANLGNSAMEALAAAGVLDGLPESAQIDLFSLI